MIDDTFTALENVTDGNRYCNEIKGWMAVIDKDRFGDCAWNYAHQAPVFKYSSLTTSQKFMGKIFLHNIQNLIKNEV